MVATNQGSGEKEPNLLIIGCDYHPSFQQIAMLDSDTGELQERRLKHREEAEQFYRTLATAGARVRVGMEASRHASWFERLLGELNFEPWVGHAARIAAKRVRKQKTGSFTWQSDEVERSPKSPWPEGWGFVCTGCGAEDGITSNWKASVRRRDGWVGLSSAPETIASEPWSDMAVVQLERNGALLGVHGLVCSKRTLTAPTMLEMAIWTKPLTRQVL